MHNMTKNNYSNNSQSFKSCTSLGKNQNIVIILAKRKSRTVILKNIDYVDKISKMIDERITNRKYIEASDTTHVDLKRFQDFLDRKFRNKTFYDDMTPISNKPAC